MFEWGSYFELAKTLCSQEGEASKRSAISRAYYSVFCLARNWLKSRSVEYYDKIEEAENVHDVVWKIYDSRTDPTSKKISANGRRLKYSRNRVDYDDEVVGLEKTAEHALRKADSTLRLFSSLR